MDRCAPDEVNLEALRSFYAALGPGFALQARRVFEGADSSAEEQWCAGINGLRVGCFDVSSLSSDRLFVLPRYWELTRVTVDKVVGRQTKRGYVVRVKGHFYCRVRGDSDVEEFPFLHMWTMLGGRALRLESFFDGLEFRRTASLGVDPRQANEAA